MTKEKFLEKTKKILFSFWFQLVLIVASSLLCFFILYGQDFFDTTISRSAVQHEALFIIWVVCILAIYDTNIIKLNVKYNESSKKVKTPLIIANACFIMCSVHVWENNVVTFKGMVLHTMPVLTAILIFYALFVYMMLMALKKQKSKKDIVFFALMCFIALMSLVCIVILKWLALGEILLAYGLLPSIYYFIKRPKSDYAVHEQIAN